MMVNRPITCTIPKKILDINNLNEEWYKEYFNMDYWKLVYYSCASIETTDNELIYMKAILEEAKVVSILDLFCGIGRHANRLSEEGYKVTGVDINPETIEIAKSEKTNVNYIVQDVRHFEPVEKYDACLLMQTSFGYFSDSENKEIIGKIYNLLNQNGILIIDIPNRDNMLKNFGYRDWLTIGETTYCISHQFDYINSRRNTTMKVIDKSSERETSHSIRMYTIVEIINILESSGFSVKRIDGDFFEGNVRFNNDSRRIQLVAQKK